MQIDASQLREFSQDLEVAAQNAPKKVRGVVSKGALNIKKSWSESAAASRHFGQVAPTINYDIRGGGDLGALTIEAEVGPDKRRRAARLANIYHFGTSRGGGTGGDPRKFLESEIPAFEQWLGDIAEDV